MINHAQPLLWKDILNRMDNMCELYLRNVNQFYG